MLPEELARVKIDKQLNNAGWDIIARNEYLPDSTVAVKEALMKGNTESDYLLFVDGKAIAVVEAKKEANNLGDEGAAQAESSPQSTEHTSFVDWRNRTRLVPRHPHQDYLLLSSLQQRQSPCHPQREDSHSRYFLS